MPRETMMHATPDSRRRHGPWVWLRSLGLGRYEAAFRENEIDETVLPSLTQEDLKELGVRPSGIAGYSRCYRRFAYRRGRQVSLR